MANTYFDTAKIIGKAGAVAVSTVGSSNIGSDSADLEGSLDNLGSDSSVDVSFEYRETGAASWNQTSTINKTSTGSYTITESGLSGSTDYEFRAFGKGADSGETATGSTLTFTTASTAVVDSLIAWYKFEDTSTTGTAIDSANNNDATINGASYTTTAKVGSNAISFDQTDDYVDVPNDILSGDFSIVCWVYTGSDTSSKQRFVQRDRNIKTNLILENGEIYEFDGTNINTLITSVSSNTWYHVSVTVRSSDNRHIGYVNGDKKNQSSPPVDAQSTENNHGTNSSLDDQWYGGNIDDARWYDKELSQSEIQTIYNNTK